MVTPASPAIDRTQVLHTTPMISRQSGGIRSRILATTGAMLMGQGVTVGIQLLSLPLYLHFWDTTRYGKWVILSAVPTYFALSDGGVVPVAANKISMLRAGGDTARANVVFQSALALVLAAILLVGMASALILSTLSDETLDADSRLGLWLLILGALFSLSGGLFDAAFRAFGSFAHCVLYANGIRVLEFLGLVAGLALSEHLAAAAFTTAALGMLAGRSAGLLLVGQICRQRFPELRWGVKHASRVELASLLKPALTFLAFPLGNGLSIQGVTLIVGALFGPVVVATFNTYRTLSRLVLQTSATFCNAVWVEFSRLYGARNAKVLRHVYHRGMLVGGGISVLLSLADIPMAPLILRFWTHGKIAFDAPLFLLFAFAPLIGGISYLPRVLLMATNQHSRLGVVYLCMAAIGLFAAYPAAETLGPGGAVLATLAVEVGMLFFSITHARRLLDEMPVLVDHDQH